MKNISLKYFVLILIACNSCKKDADKGTTTTRVKTVEYTYNSTYGYKYDVEYDGNDRILTINGDTGSIRYQYFSGFFTKEEFGNRIGSSLESKTTFFLNNNQLVDSSVEVIGSHDTTWITYSYNAAKQLSEKRLLGSSAGFHYQNRYTYDFDANGNMTTEKVYGYVGGGLSNTKNYTYTNYDAPYLLDPPYLPRLSKKLVASISSSTGVINFAYAFDANNQLVSETSTYDSGGVYTTKYTY